MNTSTIILTSRPDLLIHTLETVKGMMSNIIYVCPVVDNKDYDSDLEYICNAYSDCGYKIELMPNSATKIGAFESVKAETEWVHWFDAGDYMDVIDIDLYLHAMNMVEFESYDLMACQYINVGDVLPRLVHRSINFSPWKELPICKRLVTNILIKHFDKLMDYHEILNPGRTNWGMDQRRKNL